MAAPQTKAYGTWESPIQPEIFQVGGVELDSVVVNVSSIVRIDPDRLIMLIGVCLWNSKQTERSTWLRSVQTKVADQQLLNILATRQEMSYRANTAPQLMCMSTEGLLALCDQAMDTLSLLILGQTLSLT